MQAEGSVMLTSTVARREFIEFAQAFQAYLRYHHWVSESQLELTRQLVETWSRKNADRLQQNRRTFGEDMVHALRIRFVTQWDADEIERMADAFDEWFAAAMQHYQRTGRWIQPPTQGQGRPYGTFYGMMPAEDDAED